MTEVEADSPAMKAGIQNGDIITHIDKKKIESVIGYHSTMITQDVGAEVTLTGQRRGAEEYVEIHFTDYLTKQFHKIHLIIVSDPA